MADIVNLRQARKQRARAKQEKNADANRKKHGMTKAERLIMDSEKSRLEKNLSGKRLDGGTLDRDVKDER